MLSANLSGSPSAALPALCASRHPLQGHSVAAHSTQQQSLAHTRALASAGVCWLPCRHWTLQLLPALAEVGNNHACTLALSQKHGWQSHSYLFAVWRATRAVSCGWHLQAAVGFRANAYGHLT